MAPLQHPVASSREAGAFSRRSFVAAGASAFAAPALARLDNIGQSPVVRISGGKVAGAIEGGVLSFKGIPYGAPTGGTARFLPAAPRKPWSEIFDASRFGPRCPQRGGLGGPQAPGHSEDCLVANVWTSSLTGERPVMVWLHGGGWEVGGSDDPVTNGAWLARNRDVVVVSINHRLSVYGYLDLAAIAGEPYALSGSAGLLDIALALAWVRENIDRFGGDPDRVMIFGQSGGGRKVSTLMATPAAAGLFHRGVAQSGPGLRMDGRDVAADRADRLLHELGIARKDFARLAEVPTAILTAAGIKVRNDTGQFRPFVDGASLPQHPFLPHAPSMSAGVPMMIGTTRDETAVYFGTLPDYAAMRDDELLRQSQRFFPDGQAQSAIDAWRKMYPDFSNEKLFARLTTDRSYMLDANLLAESKAALGRAPAFLYALDWTTTFGELQDVAPHGLELPFVFGNLSASRYRVPLMPEADALRDAMSGAWASFARDGTPDHPAIPQWPPYEASRRATMLFGSTVHLAADPFAGERTFMAQFGSEQLAAYEPRPPGPWIRD